MNLLIEKKLSHPTKTKTNHNKLILMLPTSQFQSQMGKKSQKIATGAGIRNHCKAFIYLFFMEKEISFHSPIMFPQLMLESGLLYFLVESGQVQGQAGVGGRDWGDIVPLAAGRGRRKKSTSALYGIKGTIKLYNSIPFLVSKWRFTSIQPHSFFF